MESGGWNWENDEHFEEFMGKSTILIYGQVRETDSYAGWIL